MAQDAIHGVHPVGWSGPHRRHLVEDILRRDPLRIVGDDFDVVRREQSANRIIREDADVFPAINEPFHELRLHVIDVLVRDQNSLHVADRVEVHDTGHERVRPGVDQCRAVISGDEERRVSEASNRCHEATVARAPRPNRPAGC